jgi:hypothetical protein
VSAAIEFEELAMVWWTAVFTVLIHGELSVSQCGGLSSGFWGSGFQVFCGSRPLVSGALVLRGFVCFVLSEVLIQVELALGLGPPPPWQGNALPFTFPRLLSRYYPAPGLWFSGPALPFRCTRWLRVRLSLAAPPALFICGLASSFLLCFAYCFAHNVSPACHLYDRVRSGRGRGLGNLLYSTPQFCSSRL